MNNYNGNRISKAAAKKLYNNGEVFIIAPCKAALNTPWHIESEIDGKLCLSQGWSFEQFINNYIYYNCKNNQLGKYPAFYRV